MTNNNQQISRITLLNNNYSLVKEDRVSCIFKKQKENKYTIEFIFNKIDQMWQANLKLMTKFGLVNINSLNIIHEFKLSSSVSSTEEAIEYFWNKMN